MINKNEKNRLLKIRKQKRKAQPSFRRVESWRRIKVKDSWRKARGIDNKTRRHMKMGVKHPNRGYRVPKDIRDLHPSGLKEVNILHLSDLEGLSPKVHCITINARLGNRKKVVLLESLEELGYKVLNSGIKEKTIKELEEELGVDVDGDEDFDEEDEALEEDEDEDDGEDEE